MKRTVALLAALVLMVGSLSAQSQDRLLPQKKRITDEAIARDRGLIQTWLARAEALPEDRDDGYGRARAVALLEFVGSEYDRANRSPVLDTSFVQAVAIIQRLESGQTWYEKVSEPVGAEMLAPGAWARLDSLKSADVNRCAESEIARAQVKLLLAVEEGRAGGVSCSGPVVAEVEALVDKIKRLIATCTAEPADTKQAGPEAPPPVPLAPAPDTVTIPAQVHFAFDRATLSPASRDILGSVAAELAALPDAEIQLDAYSDPVGTASYNRRLSTRRGEAVREYLVSKGITPARISVVPMGASAPTAEGNSLRERYALDRRVDIQVKPPANTVIVREEQRSDLQLTPERRPPTSSAPPSAR